MPLVVGTGILVLCMRRRARFQAPTNKQQQGEGYKVVEVPMQDIGEAQRVEMDAAVERAGRSELSPGMHEETRGMLELDGN